MNLRIKDYTTKVGSGVTPKGGAESYLSSGIPLFRSQNVHNFGFLLDDIAYISEEIDEQMSGSRVMPGDVLLNITGASIGRCYFTSEDFKGGNVNQHVCIIRPNQKIVKPAFLHYLIISDKGQMYIDLSQTGANRQGLTIEEIRNFSFDIPSIKDQQRIVDYLDKKLAAIDHRVEVLEKEKDAYARLKKSVINQTVTHGLNPNVSLKDSGIDWLGMIPEHWEVKRLKSLFKECKDVTETGGEDLLSVSEYYGVARRLDKMEDGEYESRAESLIGYRLCKKGDLVINIMLAWKRGLGFSDYDGIVSPSYAVYRGKDTVPHYYHYLMRTDMYVAEYKRNSKGIIDSRLRLYNDRFNNILTIVPPLSEQQAIADYLDEKCAKIDAAIENISKQIEASKRLKKAIINEAISGKINFDNN
jgi:type I restriction enzyme S subunit